MACQDRRKKLGSVQCSASEVRRWEVDLKIIEICGPSAQGFFHKFDACT
jgi:hypothetical protein